MTRPDITGIAPFFIVKNVPATLAFFTGESFFQQPTAAISAAAVVVTIPVIALVLIFQRKIVAGLTSGAVKG